MIISRTPFRLSFAGGGTDLQSYYRSGYGQVLSTTIDKYMYITVNRSFDDSIRISYNKTEIVAHASEVRHPIVRAALERLGLEHGLEIISMADIPSGTGLGSSSSFTVGLLNALYAYQGVFVSPERLAAEACEIEIDILKEPIGKQDQYIAAYGGINVIRFNADETVFVNPVICTRDTKDALNEHLAMFYTGDTRRASDILKQHAERAKDNQQRLTAMRDLSGEVAQVLTEGTHLSRVGDIMHAGWELKRGVADGVSNNAIDQVYRAARSAGALGGKIAGAGGGGFLFLFVEKQNRRRVAEAAGLREIPFRLEPQGSKILYVGTDR